MQLNLYYLKSWLRRITMCKTDSIKHIFPLGHFYSPVADPDDIRRRETQIWNTSKEMSGINFNEQEQLLLLRNLASYVGFIDYPINPPPDPAVYYYSNDQFPVLDAEVLFTFLAHYKPANMIEIGSGFSSLIAADVNRRLLERRMDFTCIEPFPRQFLLDGVDGISRLIVSKVEDMSLAFFEKLGKGDILFIDSSHVSKVGSDVNYLFFEIIPRLKPGVMVHIHDIFLPQEYPKKWVIDEGRNWNEQYLLRAFLQFNDSFEVIWASYFMSMYYLEEVKNVFPRFPKLGGGGSIWLRRCR